MGYNGGENRIFLRGGFMKKFLIFLVSIVVVVCLGLTTFYFLRNDEIISIGTKEIFCNVGDIIKLEKLNIQIKKASKKTNFDYNASDDATKFLEYSEEKGGYIVKQGGDVSLVITTSNKKYPEFYVSVHIGDGTENNPFVLFNQADLNNIGTRYADNVAGNNYFRLMSDIILNSDFAGIDVGGVFDGNFDGNGHTISNLSITGARARAGLFEQISRSASVKDLCISDSTLDGTFDYAGILAGTCKGKIKNVSIKNSEIKNNRNNGVTGGMIGLLTGEVGYSYAENIIIDCASENPINAVAGGLFGTIDKATVKACYATGSIEANNATGKIGGFAGRFVIGTQDGTIQQSYAMVESSSLDFGAFVGSVDDDASFDQNKANFLRHFVGNMAVVYDSVSEISDDMLVKSKFDDSFADDKKYFVNKYKTCDSVFFDNGGASSLYSIRGVKAEDIENLSASDFVFYAVVVGENTTWDFDYVWNFVEGLSKMPTLLMNNIDFNGISSEYLNKYTESEPVREDKFADLFKTETGLVEDKNIRLVDKTINLSNWTPVSLKNCTIDGLLSDGSVAEIVLDLDHTDKDGVAGLFGTLYDGCVIKNLKIKINSVKVDAKRLGGLAGYSINNDTMASNLIENVFVDFSACNFENKNVDMFGGVVASASNSNITNCRVEIASVENLNVTFLAGVVFEFRNGTVENSNVIATKLVASKSIAGVVGNNFGTVKNVAGNINIEKVNGSDVSDAGIVGGVVASNEGTVIDSNNLLINIAITGSDNGMCVGGIAGINTGTIKSTQIKDGKIEISSSSNVVYVGGLVGRNAGNIELARVYMTQIGNYYSGNNQRVGGLASINDGTISKCVVGANLEGNFVAGLVVDMKKTNSSSIDQVLIATKDNGKISITGDKLIAGLAVDFRFGTISNIQSKSVIEGKSNSTRSSLIVLIFPNGATLNNSTIDSEIGGYGTKYAETWADFSKTADLDEFGISDLGLNGLGSDNRFNIFMPDAQHGSMQSVVINSSNAGVGDTIKAMGNAFLWAQDYDNTDESSFVKYTTNFGSSTEFQGSVDYQYAQSQWFSGLGWFPRWTSRNLTFDMSETWQSSNGISLRFVNE